MAKEKKVEPKYRFIFLGFACVLLAVFSAVIGFNKELAQTIILYTTAGILFVFGLIRFVPLMKHLDDKRRLILNAIEIFSNILIGLFMIFISIKTNGNDFWMNMYCYLLSLVLFSRGTIFIVEGMYCEGEKEVLKFIVHLIFIVLATIIIAKDLDITNLRYLIIAIALLAGLYCGVDSYRSYNNRRKLYANKEKEETKEKTKKDKKEAPIMDHVEEREEVYVN